MSSMILKKRTLQSPTFLRYVRMLIRKRGILKILVIRNLTAKANEELKQGIEIV